MTSLVRWLLAAMLVMIGMGCQTAPEDPKGPQTYKAKFSITESHKIPTTVKWSTGSDSAAAQLESLETNLYGISIPLASPPNNPVNVDLYRAGLLYYRLRFDYTGTTALTLNSGALAPNDVAIELLKRLGDKATDSSVASEVARALLDNDTLVKSDLILAGKLPGLDTTKVIQEALKLLAAKNLPLKELVPSGKWILDIDTLSIHVRMRDLSLSGTIVVDTNKLFPPYPVRVTQALAITGEIQAGGSALAVSGVFEATNKLVTNSVKIFRDNDDVTTGFDFPVNFDLLDQPSKLDLSGKLSIAAKPTTAAGTYRLEIILKDQDAFFAKATLEFQVVTRPADTGSTPAKDTIKPTILRQAGTENREVAYDVSEIAVGWTVSDASSLKVTIQGAPVTAKDGAYTATVVLGNATTVIRIRATDSANNEATDSVIIRRGSEPGAPVVTREPGTKDSAVAYSVTSLKLAWKISDATQVTLNGSPVQGVDGIYTIQAAPLKVGANGYKLVAKNAAGKESSDTITISRAYHDSIFPVAVAENGTKDTTVPNATDKISLSWKVTDNDKLQSVTIGGLAATVVGDIYSAILPLKPGENVFELIATDTAKNTAKKSVTVIRTPDAGAPVIIREAGTKDSTVAYATTGIKLSWKVTDDVGVSNVEINGTVVTGTAGIYSIDAKNLAIGKNGFRIEAKDAGGKSSFDTLTIIRIGDTSAPKIAREVGTKDSTVAYGTTAIKLSWKVTDDVGIASVEINGTVVTGTDGVYSLDAKNLAIGKNGFKIIAKDVLGKSSSDSVTVILIGDVSAPVIVRETGTKDSAIAYGTTTLKLGWKVTDDVGIASVEINGTVITANAGIYVFEAKNLAIGKNEVKIVAKDVAGKSSSDLVTITRAWKDTIAPSIVRQTGTKPQSVPNGTTSISVSWTVTDSLLKTVTIQGVAKTLSSIGIYSATIPLTVGNNSVSIVAVDNQGNTTKDEFIVVREAPAAKHSATSGKYIGTVYDTLLAPGADSIQYSIDGINWKTAINGIAQVKATGVFSLTAKSFPGGAASKIDLEMKQVKQIKSNGSSSWFVMEDGSAWATGNNGNGQLGTGSTAGEFTPIKVMSDVKSISAGSYHTLFLLNDGSLYATGANFSGELCDGTLSAGEFSPKKIASGVSKIAAGGSTTFYQIGSTLYGCGSNYNGQLAVGYTSLSEPTPLKIPLDNITTASVGSEFSLFINSYRIASGAGNNSNGELGLGEVTGDSVSRTITADAVDISAGSQHAVFLLSDRSVRTTGGLGNGNGTAEKQTTPYQLSIPNGASAISASDRSTLILSRDGKLYFTGLLVTTWDRWPGGPEYLSPTVFANDVASIAAGGLHHYFIKTDGTLWAFGWIGEMYGNETEIVAQTPVQINF